MNDMDILWQQDNSWRLRLHRARLPDGTAVSQGVIDHPGSVVLVPVRPSAVPAGALDVLMLRQYRYALEATILELPAGTRGWAEDWLICAQRELREETGYRAETLTFLGDIWPAPGLSNERMKIYLAQSLSPDPLPGDKDEQIELTPIPLPDLISIAQDGRLQDAKSVVGILRAAVHLRQL